MRRSLVWLGWIVVTSAGLAAADENAGLPVDLVLPGRRVVEPSPAETPDALPEVSAELRGALERVQAGGSLSDEPALIAFTRDVMLAGPLSIGIPRDAGLGERARDAAEASPQDVARVVVARLVDPEAGEQDPALAELAARLQDVRPTLDRLRSQVRAARRRAGRRERLTQSLLRHVEQAHAQARELLEQAFAGLEVESSAAGGGVIDALPKALSSSE